MTNSMQCAGAVEVVAGDAHSCARMLDGTVRCWGANGYGQLGDGTKTQRNAFITVVGLSDVIAISAGAHHTCAVVSGGYVHCWGANWYGQLGDGTTTERLAPVAVPGLSNVTAIAGSFGHTCAIANGVVRCWGDNGSGQLGNGTNTASSSPVAVQGLSMVTAVTAGASHTCAIVEGDGSLRCWGDNSFGQLGDERWTTSSLPVVVLDLSGVVSVGAGMYHTCAVTNDGETYCWGSNERAQLGIAPWEAFFGEGRPRRLLGLPAATSVASGDQHNCARLTDGSVSCWGASDNGLLGDFDIYWSSETPVMLTSLSNVASLAAGSSHNCARQSDNTIRCWGRNGSGELGNATFTDSAYASPVIVAW